MREAAQEMTDESKRELEREPQSWRLPRGAQARMRSRRSIPPRSTSTMMTTTTVMRMVSALDPPCLCATASRSTNAAYPSPKLSALATSIAGWRSLRSKVAAQSAARPHVKAGKAKPEQGLRGIVVAYTKLNVAFGEHTVSPEAAKVEVANAGIAVDKARAELAEGVKLLR